MIQEAWIEEKECALILFLEAKRWTSRIEFRWKEQSNVTSTTTMADKFHRSVTSIVVHLAINLDALYHPTGHKNLEGQNCAVDRIRKVLYWRRQHQGH